MSSLDPALATAYLARLGCPAPSAPSEEALRTLHRAHLERVPFENLDIHLGTPIVLDSEAFADKVAVRSRGGFCYELNGAFAALLTSLGLDVELREARVYGPAGLGGRFGHLTLATHVGGRTLLTEVGFGRGGFDEPIDLDSRAPQPETGGVFELVDAADEDGWVDLIRDGEPQYRFSREAHELADYSGGCAFHQTSEESPFTRGTVCTIRTPLGRTRLAGTRLIETEGEGRRERELGQEEFGDVLHERFAIRLAPAEVDRLYGVAASPVAGAVR
jgi:N-hydroxyarylamine O-acetyltransferase